MNANQLAIEQAQTVLGRCQLDIEDTGAQMRSALAQLAIGLVREERARTATPAATSPDPAWMQAALGELAAGVREVVGAAHSPQVLAYLATCHRAQGGNLGNWAADRDETPWCSAFVNWCTLRAGIEGTRNAAARSWLDWGVDIEPLDADGVVRRGAIAVLTRKGGGHVGLLDRIEADQVVLVGGNQGNAVSRKAYQLDRVIGFRWPEGQARP